MNDETEGIRSHRQQTLLKAKFGELLAWTLPRFERTVGPYDLSPFEVFDAERRRLILACEAKLEQYTQAEIHLLAEGVGDDPGDIRRGWKMFLDDPIRRLINKEPQWYAGGFGHPEHVADFETWCRMDHLNLREALCLSIGVNPHDFSERSLETLQKSPFENLAPQLKLLLMRFEQLQRKFGLRGPRFAISSSVLLRWVEEIEMEVHPEFLRLMRRYHGAKKNGSAPVQPKAVPPIAAQGTTRPDAREVASMARLILAIAIEEYGYQPGSLRSPIPKEIADIAAEHGIAITPETVRKFLLIGARHQASDKEDD